jgi:hypothetical protein
MQERLGRYLCFAVFTPQVMDVRPRSPCLYQEHSSMKACQDEALFTVIISPSHLALWTRGPGQMVTVIAESTP